MGSELLAAADPHLAAGGTGGGGAGAGQAQTDAELSKKLTQLPLDLEGAMGDSPKLALAIGSTAQFALLIGPKAWELYIYKIFG